MLKIEKMDISGFKSFSDETEVVFPEGITAVVGPNGCGKSNIGDAINWVLGEQSARMLRGSSMQDVIFNGSESRKPLGFAEVSLHLAGRQNGNGADPKAIKITRRLFRSGESEYLVNGAKSRLRDIQDLLREERVGAQTYATIEQGRIDQILNAKPKDRRLIIEEAAGVAGFKHKRRLAEMKLEATQANLLRVNDILQEVERQINSLKRQAARARRYGRLRDELRAKEGIRFGARARRLDDELLRIRTAEAAAREAEAQAAARLARSEAAQVAERSSLDEAERAHRDEGAALHQLELDIDRAETRLTAGRDRIAEADEAEGRLSVDHAALEERRGAAEAEAQSLIQSLRDEQSGEAEASQRLDEHRRRVAEATLARDQRRERVESLRRELFAAMNRLADARQQRLLIEETVTRIQAQRERLEHERDGARLEHERVVAEAAGLGTEAARHTQGVAELREAVTAASTGLAELRARLAAEQETLATERDRESSASASLRTLEDVAARFAGVSDGVRLMLTAGPAAGVRCAGVVADFVEATPEVEAAAEAYLEGFLPAVIVEDDGDARRAAALVGREGAGRTLFVSKTQPSGAQAVDGSANGASSIPDAVRSDPRVLGRLKDRLRLRSGDGFVSSRIGNAVLVDSLESALALHRQWPEADYLAMSGEVVYASGVIAAGGRASADRGLLAHTRRIAETKDHLAAAAASAAAAAARVDVLRAEVAAADAMLVEKRRALDDATRLEAEIDSRARRSTDDRDRAARRLDVIADEILVAAAEAQRVVGALAAAQAVSGDAEAAHASSAKSLEDEARALDADDEALRGTVDAEAAARADAAARAQRVEAAQRECSRSSEARADIEARIESTVRETDAARQRRVESLAIVGAAETELVSRYEQRRVGTLAATAREESLAERRSALQEADTMLRGERLTLDTARADARDREIERTRVEADRGFLDDLCAQELGITAGEALAAAGEEAVGAADEPQLESEIAEIKAKVDAIGPVNLMAIDEYQTLEERHTTLAAQKKDLDDAIVSLRESIKRINRQSREMFVEAFEAIRLHYREIFKVLFNGGRADLVLEEGEDVLESGIDMIAQPPGKRLGHISLLSGGEKSMAALALLFAIFRHRPSPFCLLDEVDAALDELNVGRFTRMLSEYAEQTQFILITHNKRSMESANLLYGVTMEEAGVSKLVSLAL